MLLDYCHKNRIIFAIIELLPQQNDSCLDNRINREREWVLPELYVGFMDDLMHEFPCEIETHQ